MEKGHTIDDGLILLSPEQFDYSLIDEIKIQKRKRGNQGTKDRRMYKDIITAFDIETTLIDDIQQSIMYIWQWAIGPNIVVIGRTWEEFISFRDRVELHLKDNEYIVVYVHNLSYEFQFLSGIYDFEREEVFALGPRKPAKCEMDNHFEFRCSYIHTNMNLKKFCESMNVKHQKLSGDDFNYSIKRYPWTKLSDQELQYCVNDVVGLVEALKEQMRQDKDNLYTIPMTATGYVRRDAKVAMQKVNRLYIKQLQPNWHIYEMLREAFRGGNTHANRYYAERILDDVISEDRSSSYPAVLCNCLYPMKPFFEYGPASPEEVIDMITRRKKAVIMRVKFWNIRLQDDGWGCPYLSRDKCRNISQAAFDNGRILEAEYLETTITDIDFRILMDEYEWDHMEAYDVAHSAYGKLPKSFTDLIIGYYHAKTELKGVPDKDYEYRTAKTRINSIYGFTAYDPVKIADVYEDGLWSYDMEADPQDILYTYEKRAFVPYQWGVWCTAHARYALEEGIRLAGDDFVYCDTDSVKHLGHIDFAKYNNERIKESLESGSYATDPKGITHYMGVYEDDGVYDKFITMGAKKYAVEEDGHIYITVAGVGKKVGAKELERAGGLSAFNTGFVFREAGGNEVRYNDEVPAAPVIIEGNPVTIVRNVAILPSEYTLGVTDEYQRLIDNPKILHRIGIDNFVQYKYNNVKGNPLEHIII